MRTIIDSLDTTTGWTASAGCAIHGLNTVPAYIAGYGSASLVLSFPVAGYCTKTLAAPVTLGLHDKITLSVWSQRNGNIDYQKYTDFVYKIKFGTAKEYYLPVSSLMNDVTFDVDDLTTIEEITITYSGTVADYLIVSLMVMAKDELPYDIFFGLKERFDSYILAKHSTRFYCGAVAPALEGDNSVFFLDNPIYADRYAKVMITDGTNTEYHHIDRKDDNTLELHLGSIYDGPVLLHNYLNGASVYLCIPFEFGRSETDIVLPSIVVWGLAPQPYPIESDIQTEYNTWKSDGTVNARYVGDWCQFPLLIDCESLNTETMALASEVCRIVLAQEWFWVNGRKFDIVVDGPATQVDALEANDIDKIQYRALVAVNEDTWDNVRLPITSTINFEAELYLNDLDI